MRVALLLGSLATAAWASRSETSKSDCELNYWRKARGGEDSNNARRGRNQTVSMSNGWYKRLFTALFDLDLAFYNDKKVLDIGCGPRGSLEFLAGVARATVCVDPLALNYSALGAWSHSMVYVGAPAEVVPLASSSFDVVSSLNSIDHVESHARVLAEVARLLRPGGMFLLYTHVGLPPTPCEPSSVRAGFESDAANAGLRAHSVRYYVTNETGANPSHLIKAISTGAAAPVSAADVERLVSIPNFKHAQAVGHRKGNDAMGRPRRIGSLIGMFEKKI